MSQEISASDSPLTSTIAQKAQLEVLLDYAQKKKRNIINFMEEAKNIIGYSEDIAASCIFALPRKFKNEKTQQWEQGYIKGKSVRLAEIIYSVYENIKVDVWYGQVNAKTATAFASVIDLQSLTFFTEEGMAQIQGTHGDAAKLAQNAAKSIAIRNAIFRIVPGAFSAELYKFAVEFSIGDQELFPVKRKKTLEYIAKRGIPLDRILSFYNKKTIEELDEDLMEEIVGVISAIKEKLIKIDDAFIPDSKNVVDDGDNFEDFLQENSKIKTPTYDKKTGEVKPKKIKEKPIAETITPPVQAPITEPLLLSQEEKIERALEKATDVDTLQVAADLIRTIDEKYQKALRHVYYKRLKTLTNDELELDIK